MAEQWLATLSEVRRQAARVAAAAGVQPPDADGTWYDVAEGTIETSDLETVEESGAWRGLQWLNAFEILFFERPSELPGLEHQDDLLFFVVQDAFQGDAGAALLVRRRGRAMPEDLARGARRTEQVDWAASVLLNLVIQAGFQLTVAACRRTDMYAVLEPGQGGPASASKVTKAVYASPMNLHMSLEGARVAQERPSVGYPNIAFGVEDFEEAFKSLVLSEPGWCYVVKLAATGGMALTSADLAAGNGGAAPAASSMAGNAGAADTDALEERLAAVRLQDADLAPQAPDAYDDPLRQPTDNVPAPAPAAGEEAAGQEGASRAHPQPASGGDGRAGGFAERGSVPLFTGFVSHEQLEEVMGSRWDRREASRREAVSWVKMRGPGGQGHADVAVTCLPPLDEGHIRPPPAAAADNAAAAAGKRPNPRSTAASRVLDAFAKAAKGVLRDALGGSGGLEEHVRMRCALMRLSLPVELLAAQLLRLPLHALADADDAAP